MMKSLKNFFKEEYHKLIQMNPKDRKWYILEYYKAQIIGVLVGIIILFYIGLSIYNNTFESALRCLIINNYSDTPIETSSLEEQWHSALDLGKKQTVTVETGYISYEGTIVSNADYAYMAKISALVTSNALDFLIADEATIQHFASNDGFLNLETELSPEILELVQDHLYYTAGSDGTLAAYAIDISDITFTKETGLTQTPPLLSLFFNSEQIENLESLILYLFEEPLS